MWGWSRRENLFFFVKDGDVIREKSELADNILTVIVQGMHMGQTDSVRFAAANAMLNSLQFTRKNFEHTQERNEIMKVICEATQSKNTKIQVVGLQCLVNIMSLYYQHMEEYMGPALFPVSHTHVYISRTSKLQVRRGTKVVR